MTTSQRMDAIEMTRYRRRPFPETPQATAYLDMMDQVRQLQNALVAAKPEVAESQAIAAKLAEVTELVQGLAVSEHEQLYGVGEMGGSISQALLPPLTLDFLDDEELRAHFTAGPFAMGTNQVMHGGVISAIFDTVMGRMALGLDGPACRTAYLNTQYRSVAPIGERLELRARVASIEGRKRFITAELFHGETLCAEADALFVELRSGHQ